MTYPLADSVKCWNIKKTLYSPAFKVEENRGVEIQVCTTLHRRFLKKNYPDVYALFAKAPHRLVASSSEAVPSPTTALYWFQGLNALSLHEKDPSLETALSFGVPRCALGMKIPDPILRALPHWQNGNICKHKGLLEVVRKESNDPLRYLVYCKVCFFQYQVIP